MKKLLAFTTCCLLAVSLVSCGGPQSGGNPTATGEPSGEEKIVINYAGTTAENQPLMMGAYAFKEYMEANSDGRVEVNLYPNGQLGSGRELAEAVQAGTITLCDNAISNYSAFTDKYLGLSLPFMFTSSDILEEFLNSDLLQRMNEEVAADTNLRTAAFCLNGTRSLSSSKHAIVTPADLTGQKIRVMESPLYLKMFEAMGANPIPMSFSELYTAMQQGTIDGQDNPPVTFYTNAYYEVQDYFTYLGHTKDISVCMCNQTWYSSLPDDIRELFDAGMAVYRETVNEAMASMEGGALEDLKDVINVTVLDDSQISVFKDACMPVYDWYREEYDDAYLDEIIAEVDSIADSLT